MPLKLSLKPGEKFVLNGAVLANGDKRTSLVIQNKACVLREKDILRFEGPLGCFRLHEDSAKPIVLVAGGTGFAPVKSMVEHTIHSRITRPMAVYWGARNRFGVLIETHSWKPYKHRVKSTYDILVGLAELLAERGAAIAWVIAQAAPGDVVLLAGKGHEDYQDVAGVKHPFSDIEVAQAGLQARSAA